MTCDDEGMREVFERIVQRLVDACGDHYGDRLRGVVVYGSVALGTMRPDSDVDVLVVVDDLPDGRGARVDEFGAVDARLGPVLSAAREDGVDTRISPIIRAFDELDRSGFLLFDIACDGDIRFDRSGDVAGYLERVRQRLQERGAERRPHPAGPYWVLEPDVKPGQVVEL